MRVLTPYDLARMTRSDLDAMLRHITQLVPTLPAGSADWRAAHANLQAIRRVLTARPGGPRP